MQVELRSRCECEEIWTTHTFSTLYVFWLRDNELRLALNQVNDDRLLQEVNRELAARQGYQHAQCSGYNCAQVRNIYMCVPGWDCLTFW